MNLYDHEDVKRELLPDGIDIDDDDVYDDDELEDDGCPECGDEDCYGECLDEDPDLEALLAEEYRKCQEEDNG